MENLLREKIKQRPLFGITIMSASVAAMECVARNGYDYAFLDAEHTPWEVTDLREMILAARLADISPLVRITGPDPIEIRKVLEMGAEGVIIPHIRTREEMQLCVTSAKFPPLGRRGYDSAVRSAGYGTGNYDADRYIDYSNATELVIPMAEDYEFIDNIDDILSVPGVDIISFGPADFALSKSIRVFYKMDMPEVDSALSTILDRAEKKGIAVMSPALPPTADIVRTMTDKGVRMLTVGTDLSHLNNGLSQVQNDVIKPFLAQR